MMAARASSTVRSAERPDSTASRSCSGSSAMTSSVPERDGRPQPPGPPDADRDPGQQHHDEQGVEQHGHRDVRRRSGSRVRPERGRGRRRGVPDRRQPASRAEPLQVQPRQHEHGGADRARAEHEQEHPAQLDRGRLLAAPRVAHEQDHEQGHDHDLEDHADDHGVLVQRPVPAQSAHRPAQPGQPHDDQQHHRQQPHQPVLRRKPRSARGAFSALRCRPRRRNFRLAAGHRLTFLV